MTTITSTPPAFSPTNTSGVSTESAKPVLSSDFETFLKMLTVQMQNQDPLNPVDSSEYAVQLATFSSVEQQVQSNDLLKTLVSQMGTMGMAQLAGWVGMEARAAVPAYFDGFPVTVSPNPARAADQARLIVRDSSGAVVQQKDIAVSTDPIQWDGLDAAGYPLPLGLYSFEVESLFAGQVIDTSTADTYARIVEARGENGATLLVMEGGATVLAQDVTAIREAS